MSFISHAKLSQNIFNKKSPAIYTLVGVVSGSETQTNAYGFAEFYQCSRDRPVYNDGTVRRRAEFREPVCRITFWIYIEH